MEILGHTVINISGENDSEIANSGNCELGKIQFLFTSKSWHGRSGKHFISKK